MFTIIRPGGAPPWALPLWQRLQRPGTGRVALVGLADWPGAASLSAEGWQVTAPGDAEPVDALIGTGELSEQVVAQLRDSGSFLWIAKGWVPQPQDWRATIEAAFGATVHLWEVHLDGGWIVAFGWKRERLSEPLPVLMVTHLGAMIVLGGSETQLIETLKALRDEGVRADVSVSLRLDARDYALVHAFGVHLPDKWEWLSQFPGKLVVSPVYWDFGRTRGETVLTLELFKKAQSPNQMHEWLDDWYTGLIGLTEAGRAAMPDSAEKRRRSRAIVANAAHLLPNGLREAEMLLGTLEIPGVPYTVVPNAVDPSRFAAASPEPFRQAYGLSEFVLCSGRVESRKNQLLLIWAMLELDLPLVIAGRLHDPEYVALCQRWASPNVRFIGELSPQMLASAYAAARVHALPSWTETPGLSNIEAALAGCNLVVGNRAIESEYFGEEAFVVDPANWRHIRDAVTLAWMDRGTRRRQALKARILQRFTWSEAARVTAEVYRQVLGR